MPSPSFMLRDPVEIPRKPGIFALLSKSARVAYVAYTQDLQKRSHSMSHMLHNPKTHWSIKALPKLAPGEFVFTVIHDGVTPKRAVALVAATKDAMRARKYKVVEGARKPTPFVTYKGQAMTLPAAIKAARCKANYITVWRRLSRGWTVPQALDIDDPPVRWDRTQTRDRKKRAEARA